MEEQIAKASREDLLNILMGLGKQMQDRAQGEKDNKVRNYRELNRYVKKGQILFTGSSLMEQFPIAEYCASEGLPVTVYNRGIGGTTSDDFLREMDTVLLDLQPSKVFLNIGTNDITTAVYGDQWQAHLLDNYRTILGRLREELPDTAVYLMAFYPVNEDLMAGSEWARSVLATRNNANIQDTNRKLAALAAEYGVHFIDVNEGIKDEQGNLKAEITVEGIHMYAGGYCPIFEALKPYILA